MHRRRFLLLAGAGFASAGLLSSGFGLRLHRSPRTHPYLTEGHLAGLISMNLLRPRVLFVGNSMVLRNDLQAVVRGLAKGDGVDLSTATAAADGARLVETIRLPGFRRVLEVGWDAVVVQDFTKTPLRWIDRLGSAHAVAKIAKIVAPTPILLYPPWPAKAGNKVYVDAGILTARPDNPADYGARTMAHYDSLGHPVAPVPDRWLAAPNGGADLYSDDGHHPNARGTALVGQVIWESLRDLLAIG